jgi:hypothetical protein
MAFAPKHERQKEQHTVMQRESCDFARRMRLTQKKNHDTRLLEIAIGGGGGQMDTIARALYER